MRSFACFLLACALAGCATPAAETLTPAAAEPVQTPELRLVEWTRWFRAGASPPGVASRDPGEPPIVPFDPATERVTVTVKWAATQPLARSIHLYVDVDGEEALSVSGPSPLVHVFEAGTLTGSSLETVVYPGPASVFVDQDVMIAILVEPVA